MSEEFVPRKEYEYIESMKTEQDRYVADILEIQSKKIKELEARVKALEQK